MDIEKLTEITKVQSEIITILLREYIGRTRNPLEKQSMSELLRDLKELQE